MNHLKAYVLDRFEGQYAILLDSYGRAYDVLRDELTPDIREGDVLHENDGIYEIDEELTKEKREKLQKIKEELTKSSV
jgi:hypothetical protein